MGSDAIEASGRGGGSECGVHDEQNGNDSYVPAPTGGPVLGVLDVVGCEI